ncbi:antibiotic biosynthesis monooxygenase [Streptomyces palmae]|uniref:Uncharacterized protein n=1 Tax=Streptomyces palmae TaxID=1701085 RepID=A0A4Z0HBH4_9ACTN|nr:antibiotic biosynthesis monooxygenase [Streptomyces palmae]TGB09177.1 hypothetical protein E4099_14190 [Streptomyces palmae]
MNAGFIAYHYPYADYRDEFARHVAGVARVFRNTPGCLSADCWITTTPDGESVVSIVRTESPQALEAAFATLRSPETEQELEAELGASPPGSVDGTNTELFARPHVVHPLTGL